MLREVTGKQLFGLFVTITFYNFYSPSNQLKIYHQDVRGLRSVDLPQVPSVNGEPLSPNIGLDANVNEATVGMEKMKIRNNTKQHGNQEIKFDEKVLHCAWHPTNNTIAVAGKTGLCLYKV